MVMDVNSWQTTETILRRKLRRLHIDDTCDHEDVFIRRDSVRFAVMRMMQTDRGEKEHVIKSVAIGKTDYTFERAVSEVVAFLLGEQAAPELQFHGVIKSGNKYLARVVVRERILWMGPHDTAEEAAVEYNDVVVEMELDRPLNPLPDEVVEAVRINSFKGFD